MPARCIRYSSKSRNETNCEKTIALAAAAAAALRERLLWRDAAARAAGAVRLGGAGGGRGVVEVDGQRQR